MKTIWKFVLPLTDSTTIEMPIGANILDAQIQCGEICLWADVDPSGQPENRGFFIVGTGHPLPKMAGNYIRTIQQDRLVWHIFEEAKPPAEEDFRKLYETARNWWENASPETRDEMLRAQRRSWVIGEMLLEHPEMTRSEVEKLVDAVDR